MTVLWVSLAVAGGIILLVSVGRLAVSLRPEPEASGMPVTPLETLGWIGLGITTAVLLGVVALVGLVGVNGFHEDQGPRFAFWLLLLIGIGIWSGSWFLIKRRFGGLVIDERDRSVLARSFAVESMIALLALVAWTVILTEAFWDEGSIPIAYLQLMFWTTFIGGALGRALGIVLGYRREVFVDG